MGIPFQPFSAVSVSSRISQVKSEVVSEIRKKSDEYILNVNEQEFLSYLKAKHELAPLNILKETELITKSNDYSTGTRSTDADGMPKTHDFLVTYEFNGSSLLFYLRPSAYLISQVGIILNESANTVSFVLKSKNTTNEEFHAMKWRTWHKAFGNIENVNAELQYMNRITIDIIDHEFADWKKEIQANHAFFNAIKVPINRATEQIFSVPTLKKVIIKEPEIPAKNFEVEYAMDMPMYLDVIRVLYSAGKAMEKKKSIYLERSEENLRDLFVFLLETRYESYVASGETFNFRGKTDIILKHAPTGNNLFVAECKFWHGEASFLKAISQLFDRYLTWRDSKVAVILFVTSKDFTTVLNNIKEVARSHPYFTSQSGSRGESSFSYLFHLPSDSNKSVYVEIMAFAFS